MTRMLARVTGEEETRLAAEAGVDGVEVWLPAVSDPAALRAIRAACPGLLRLRVEAAAALPGAIEAAMSCGVDEIALPAGSIQDAAALLRTAAARAHLGLVAVVVADDDPLVRPASPARAAMLDAPVGRRLVDKVAIDGLDAFARACRGGALPFGFAGGLEAPDVARLLLLRPDYLVFGIALRHGLRADAPLDPKAVAAIRALVPREAAGAAAAAPGAGETDVIFVHDFVAHLSIGAYQAERGVRQRVRFSVDADVSRAKAAPTDMAGIFSYDIIIETVRVLAARAHVTFVETLAEEMAATLLAYPRVQSVSVKVEKLDVIDGAIGVAIRRDRRSLLPKGAG